MALADMTSTVHTFMDPLAGSVCVMSNFNTLYRISLIYFAFIREFKFKSKFKFKFKSKSKSKSTDPDY